MKEKNTLAERLAALSEDGFYPMHMPGHKRNPRFAGELPIGHDITEIEGFDNLHDMHGVLETLSCRLARLYGAQCAFPLVNGSTCGLLAAVRALTGYGDRILMARNCHQSVYHAAELCGLQVTYLLPDTVFGICGEITPRQVEEALEADRDIRLVVVTSPTYEGVVSDIKGIADVTRRRGIPLLVDAAHGAHLGFSSGFPENPVALGADICVMSLHKTLPAPTQTAVLTCVRSYAPALRCQLSVFETSSPSYLLLEAIETCVGTLETEGARLFGIYRDRLAEFSHHADAWKHLSLYRGEGMFGFDPGKLVIRTDKTELTGPALARLLRERYRIEVEMSCPGYVLCMTGICDTAEGFSRLGSALSEIDASLTSASEKSSCLCLPPVSSPQVAMSAAEAYGKGKTQTGLSESMGLVCGEYIRAYPPGIPILVPGERITGQALDMMRSYINAGILPVSDSGLLPQKILTLAPKNS